MAATYLKITLCVLSILVFATSLSTVAFHAGVNDSEGILGYNALTLGWLSIFHGGQSWLANPLLVVTLLLMFIPPARTVGIISGFAAVLVALSFLLSSRIEKPKQAGGKDTIVATRLGPGYTLWTTSMGLALAGCIVRPASNDETKMPRGEPHVRRRGT